MNLMESVINVRTLLSVVNHTGKLVIQDFFLVVTGVWHAMSSIDVDCVFYSRTNLSKFKQNEIASV